MHKYSPLRYLFLTTKFTYIHCRQVTLPAELDPSYSVLFICVKYLGMDNPKNEGLLRTK